MATTAVDAVNLILKLEIRGKVEPVKALPVVPMIVGGSPFSPDCGNDYLTDQVVRFMFPGPIVQDVSRGRNDKIDSVGIGVVLGRLLG
jgi:hypothetical protein